MNENENDMLLRMLEGRLSEEEEKLMRLRLAESPALRQELERLQRLRWVMRASADETAGRSLKPMFSDRVLARIAESPVPIPASAIDDMVGFLSRLFRPVLAFGLLLVVALTLYNVNIASEYDEQGSITETVLGMPTLSTTAVYDLDIYSNTSTAEQ